MRTSQALSERDHVSKPALWAIAYDIADDHRRRRLHTQLRKLALPVEYSLFDCPVESAWFGRIVTVIAPLIDTQSDRLIFARLANSATVESLGAPPIVATATDCMLVQQRRRAA